ncbi:DUF1203 domain-containing protein [Caulobacter sp. KR2-114]|uniref:DUF1203 domain-containing protein n=1 Tax=Caulobacter sp. KR2-114 TaxID=3400912 RepID=UPI003BFD5346
MSYVVSGLPAEPFQGLAGLDDAALATRQARRVIAGAEGRYPCRITLEDAPAGEALLLVNYRHQDADTPYRSDYAIYVREGALEQAGTVRRFAGELPPVLKDRAVALRAFAPDGMLLGAELVAAGADLEAAIERGLGQADVAYLHAHNAAYGCFAARIDRG